MAVTNNVLNAINVFSSTSVFNSNKSSVGANDLNFIKQTTAELATEGGGIIAQSLGTNGYVKFANGLILQWGSSDVDGQTLTFTFPLAFSVLLAIAVSNGRSSGQLNPDNNPYNLSNTSFTVFTKGSFRYICVGKQQWGKRTADHEWNVTFPIAFAEICYAICVACHLDSDRAQSANVAKITTSTCQIVVSYGVGFWLAVGKQQWGQTNANTVATFPLASSIAYLVITTSYGANWGYVTNLTETSFRNANNAPVRYITICKQVQWGNCKSKTGNNFPIAFPLYCYAVIPTEYHSENVEGNTFAFNNVTTTGFTCYNVDRTKYYIACGKQQWGEQATAKPATATLPISCDIVLNAMSNYIGTKGSEYATLIYGASTTTLSVMCDYNGTLNTSKYYWLAICIQQWGYFTQGDTDTKTYPISMNRVYNCQAIAHCPQTSGSSYVYGARIKAYTTTSVTVYLNTYKQDISGWWFVLGK